jgi:hypothetical protein
MEKATRVLTDEDKEMMERPIEGKNGELRKIEVGSIRCTYGQADADVCVGYLGSFQAQKRFPV